MSGLYFPRLCKAESASPNRMQRGASSRKKFAASLLSAVKDGSLEKSLKDFEESEARVWKHDKFHVADSPCTAKKQSEAHFFVFAYLFVTLDIRERTGETRQVREQERRSQRKVYNE